jgi:hypothetical protein
MAIERGTVYESSQWGVETTLGVGVPAIKRLLCTEVDPEVMPNIRHSRPMGIKFDTEVQEGKEHATARLLGDIAFNDMAYILSGLLGQATITVPNSSIWTVGVGAASAGAFTLTLDALVSAPIAYNLSPAAVQVILQTAWGTGSVQVSGIAGAWIIRLTGYLSTTAFVITGVVTTPLTGGALAIAESATAILSNRWKWTPAFNTSDVPQTFTVEKGAYGIANFAQQLSMFIIQHLELKVTSGQNAEATFQGDAFSNATIDPFTMTTTSVVNVPAIVADPSSCSIFIGTSLVGANAPTRLTRCLEFNFTITGNWRPVMTLDDSIPSLSGVVQGSATWEGRLTLEHDSTGIAQLANMRAKQKQYLIMEFVSGILIEAGFPYRLKMTIPCNIINAPKQDQDGLYSSIFDIIAVFDPAFAGGIMVELDNGLTSL